MTKFAPSYIYHAQAHHLILLNKQQNYIRFCDIILLEAVNYYHKALALDPPLAFIYNMRKLIGTVVV